MDDMNFPSEGILKRKEEQEREVGRKEGSREGGRE